MSPTLRSASIARLSSRTAHFAGGTCFFRPATLFFFSSPYSSLSPPPPKSPPALPPFGSFGGGPDVINLANLNSHITVPVLNKPGRGTNFTYDLSYDSSIWYPVGSSGSQVWTQVGGWGWRGQTEAESGYVSYFPIVFNCGGGNQFHDLYAMDVPRPDGSGTSDQCGLPESSGGVGCGLTSFNSTSTATDGSGYVLNITNLTTAVVYSSRGTKIIAPILTTTGSATFTDRNGNQLTADTAGHFYDTMKQHYASSDRCRFGHSCKPHHLTTRPLPVATLFTQSSTQTSWFARTSAAPASPNPIQPAPTPRVQSYKRDRSTGRIKVHFHLRDDAQRHAHTA